MAVDGNAVPEGESLSIPPPDGTDASKESNSKYGITQVLEGSMSEILRFKEAVDVMTSVLLTAAKIRI
jgi:hypothetical protein